MSRLACVLRRRANAPTVILDVSTVERMTFDALAVLVREAMRLRSAGGELLLTEPGAALRKMIDRTGTGPLLTLRTDIAAAVRSLAEDSRTWCRVDLSAAPSTLFTGSPLQ
ncbi:STAS domain-containing protein [Streptomyces albofaciens JCM 4342]|uniref:STAS domain-containing protein n=1 Tax=Streptomyces albofaciens TaxID=66866 RepID=UPI000AC40E4C|nr:STAS domain-containing protein [Streptomyces albofaciens]KAA6224522.1 STAS domain-containing protein [Streptomyces albofaciens JCM 4342]